jgi:hypothetical protein
MASFACSLEAVAGQGVHEIKGRAIGNGETAGLQWSDVMYPSRPSAAP